MATSVFNKGSYTISGISPARTGVGEAFQAGVEANLGRQDARSVMSARAEQTRLAGNADVRAQKELELRQQQVAAQMAAQRAAQGRAAQAAARANQQAAQRAGLLQGLTGAGANQPAVQPAGSPTLTAPPYDGSPFGSSVPLSFGGNVSGGAGTTVLPGKDGSDYLGPLENIQFMSEVLPAEAQRSFMTPESMAVRAGLANTPAGYGVVADLRTATDPREQMQLPGVPGVTSPMAVQQAVAQTLQDPNLTPEMRRALEIQQRTLGVAAATGSGLLDAVTDALALLQRIGTRALEYGVAVPLSMVSPELGAQFFEQINQYDEAADRLALMGQGAPSGSVAADSGVGAPAPKTPTKETSWGGLQLNFGTPVELAFGKTKGAGSRVFVEAPEKIFDAIDANNRQLAREESLLQYYATTGDAAGYNQGLAVSNAITATDALRKENSYLQGMAAIVGIQQENFGPVQEILQRRYPNQQVEVQPYTDGTVAIFLDGERAYLEDWDILAQNVRDSYDQDYISQQNAAATAEAELAQFARKEGIKTEQQGAREIAVAAAADAAKNRSINWEADAASGDSFATYITPQNEQVQLVRVNDYPHKDDAGNDAPGPAILVQTPSGQFSTPVYIAPDGTVQPAG